MRIFEPEPIPEPDTPLWRMFLVYAVIGAAGTLGANLVDVVCTKIWPDKKKDDKDEKNTHSG